MSSEGASSSSAPQGSGHLEIKQVNDSLYELYMPVGTPRLQIVFFHGLQLGTYSKAHVSTWKSADESCVWPQKWLVEEFPHAHVLTVSYGAAIERSPIRMDMYNIGENLLSDLMHYDIGQIPFCPVILVGHSFGGLVIKQVCCQAHQQRNSLLQGGLSDQLTTFLENVKGLFFYATPHHGSDCAKKLAKIINDPLLPFFDKLSTTAARLNQEFKDISKLHERWRFTNLGETLPTRLPTILGLSEDVFIVPEASARGDDFNAKDGVDHFSISKPKGKNSRNFYKLQQFIMGIDNDRKDAHQCQGLPRHSVGLEKHAQEVQERLRDADVLGIVGMGGIGKTTIAKHVFNSISREFEYTCFVENVKGIPIYNLEKLLLDSFYQSGRRIVARKISWADLEMKKTLIVTDDVDSENQLKVLPQLKAFGAGSRLIITTRNESVLRCLECKEPYRVGFLDGNQAKQLFCQYAGLADILDNSSESHQLNMNVKVVVGKCGGLPLTLEVLGRYLQGHVDDASYWEETIAKLTEGESISGDADDRVWATLKVSYDKLAGNVQKVFIEAALYFFEKPLDRALAAWSGAYGSAKTTWDDLKSKSMVKDSSYIDLDYSEVKTVWVHDQLRALAAKLEKHYVLSRSFHNQAEVDALLNSDVGHENTKIVSLEHPYQFGDTGVTLPSDFIVKLREVKYLEVTNCTPGGRFETFPNTLSVLQWDLPGGGHTIHLPTIRRNQLSNLSILELQLWKVPKEFPEVLGELTKLCILKLSLLKGFDHLPENFANLSQLQEFTLFDSHLQRLPESFGSLSKLKDLSLSLPELQCLPNSFGSLASLEHFNFWARELKCWPRNFCRLKAQKRLTIHSGTLPEDLGQLESLLYLEIIASVRHLPDNLGKLDRLERLRLDVDNVEALPVTMKQLSTLRDLQLVAKKITILPESVGWLSSLQNLEIDCLNLKKMPDNFGNLCALERLTISAESLEVLPESFGNLSSLETLVLHVKSLRNLPSKFGNLQALHSLEIRCDSLEMLPDSFGDLSSLRHLQITSSSLVSLPESIGLLPSLESFCITVPIVRDLPPRFGKLSRVGIDSSLPEYTTHRYIPEPVSAVVGRNFRLSAGQTNRSQGTCTGSKAKQGEKRRWNDV